MTGKRKAQRICDAEKNWYYRESVKKCYKCEKCVIGEGKIKFEDAKLPMHPEFGATQCIPCRQCKPGTYNDKRAFRCKHCRNCEQQGRYELRPCTHLQNAVCGDKIISGSTKKDNISNTVAPLKSGSGPSMSKTSDSSVAFVVFTLIFLLLVIMTVILIVLYRRKAKGCKKRWQKSRNNRSHQELSTEYPLMVVTQSDLPCNNRNQQERAPLPKKSNLKRISENNRSSNMDSEETTLKTTASPPKSTGKHNRIQNSCYFNRKNDQDGKRFYGNLNNQNERFHGEVNIACKENSSSSDNSTMQTNKANPEVQIKLKSDVHDAFVSGSILPIRSLSGFSYSFKAPPLDCMEDDLQGKGLSALHLSATM